MRCLAVGVRELRSGGHQDVRTSVAQKRRLADVTLGVWGVAVIGSVGLSTSRVCISGSGAELAKTIAKNNMPTSSHIRDFVEKHSP